jgi:ACS family hexuronate transporter-like MFS transporter
LRWRIALLTSAAIAISYLDRQALPVAIKAVQKEIPISNEQFSLLNTAFLLTYGIMYAVGGRLLDWLGTRIGFVLCMGFWSLACMSHGFAASVGMLAVSRLLLGAGEGGGFPAATRVIAEWFPVQERSSAMGIINAGTALGAVIAPPMIALILTRASWRWVFLVTGALGLLWAAGWWRNYFVPVERAEFAKRRATNVEDKARQTPKIGEDAAQSKRAGLSSGSSWRTGVLGHRETWGLILVKFLSDAAWYFYLFWLPKYLYDARHLDIKAVAAFAWLPYVASGVGCLGGGWLSSGLIQRGHSVNKARKLWLGAAASVMPLILFVPQASLGVAIALFTLAYFGHQWWSTLVMVLPTDLFPKQNIGAVAGLVGMGGAMGGVVFGQCVGYLLDHGFGYGPVFAVAASLHVIAFVIICLAIPTIKPLNSTAAA